MCPSQPSDQTLFAFDPVPTWLEVPPTTDIAPPVDTLAVSLPISKLTWEDFERLCLRLARVQSDVVGARMYGTPGQSQGGIDLFAHLSESEKYRVYQCKRVKSLEPSLIVAAVDKFLEGSWAERATELVLCSSDELRTAEREEAFETQRKRLKECGITLLPWMAQEVSDLLRARADIVHDFFGQPWVERFCGSEAAATTIARIAPQDVAALRLKLLGLYRAVFAVHDQGLAVGSEQPVALYDRYIVHDLIEADSDDPVPERERAPSPPAGEAPATPDPISRLNVAPSRSRRVSLEYALPAAPEAPRILLGGPGSGKSAALRYIALDLLSEAPRLSSVAQVWGRRLPIWIPFGAWVEQIERGERDPSIIDVVEHWLAQWNEADLFPLIKRALDDKRLLLLVDGLDEWTTEEAAHLALARLRVFAERQAVPVLLTSRPHGLRVLASTLPAWRVSELAPLSRGQQKKMAEQWFEQRHQSASGGAASPPATNQKQAEAALSELHELPDGAALAEVPLLLSILLVLKAEQVELPSNRFKAYAELARHLMLVQPRRRAVSADRRRRASALSDDELETAYAFLAYSIHRNHPTGTVSIATAREYFERVLREESFGLAYAEEASIRLAKELIDVGESVSGLLVKRSPRELGFYHRSIQEHLAATHLSSVSDRDQLEVLAAHAGDPQWRDVILALASRAPSSESVAKIIAAVDSSATDDPITAQRTRELRTEIAAGPGNCSVSTRTSLVELACTEIEEGWCERHRAALLRALLSGLSRQSVKRTLLPRLRRWFPERERHRGQLLRAIGKWSDVEAWGHLRLALINDDHVANRLVAAEVIAARWGGDRAKLAELLVLARRPYAPEIRAAICKALLDGWPDDAMLPEILETGGSSFSPELTLVGILRRLKHGQKDTTDRDALLELLGHSGVRYDWQASLEGALLANWPADIVVRDACLQPLSDRSRPRLSNLSPTVAWRILLEGYPMDDAVAAAIIAELGKEYQHFAHVDWSILGRQFRDHPALAARLESWIDAASTSQNSEVAGAALVGRSQNSKRKLLAYLHLGSQGFWAAGALIQGWGVADVEVADALGKLVGGQNRQAGWFAEWLPEIIGDAEKSYKRLLELLADREVDRSDFVMRGLRKLGRLEGNDEFAKVALARVGEGNEFAEQQIAIALIRSYSSEPAVRDLALKELQNPDGAHAAVAEGFSHDRFICQRVGELVAPLPVDLRRVIADHLCRFGLHDPVTIELCEDFPWEQENEIATCASLAFHRAVAAQGTSQGPSIAVLRRELACYGHYYESRRQAAFAGALELERYELIDAAAETIGDAVPLRVGMSSVYGEPNRPLIRQVMEHWPELERRYPLATLSRLQRRGEVAVDSDLGMEAWAEIADEVERESGAELGLVNWLASADSEVLEPSLLRYLSRREPGSRRLREHCKRILHAPSQSWRYEERLELATQILSQQFGSDEEFWAGIEDDVRQAVHTPYGPLTALMRARPQCSAVQEHAEPLWRSPAGRPARLIFGALCAVGSPSDVVGGVDHYWGLGRSYGAWLYRPLVDRLVRDPELRREIESVIASHRSDAARVAFSVPLAAAEPLPRTLSTQLGEVLARQLGPGATAGFTFDGRVGLARPIPSVIVELMDTQMESSGFAEVF